MIPAFRPAQFLQRQEASQLIFINHKTPQNSGPPTNGLLAVWPVNPQVVWACGPHRTFTVTKRRRTDLKR